MPGLVFNGATATLQGQRETAFRTAPTTPNTQLLKFDTVQFGHKAELSDNATITSQALLDKRDEQDIEGMMMGKHTLDLNDIGWWLALLWGNPTTTGTGPYTHTFTLGLATRPSALLELAFTDGVTARRHRLLGSCLDEKGWDVMESAATFTTKVMAAVEVRPFPATDFDTTPLPRFAIRRACTRQANIYDTLGASTLGDIAKCSINIKNDLTGYAVADGLEGLGQILLGVPSISGSMDALFINNTLMDHALANTSKKLVIVQKDSTGVASMTTTLPNIEFDRPTINIEQRKALVMSGLSWRAHNVAAAAAPTIVLVNDVATYTT